LSFENEFENYLQATEVANTHAGKLIAFSEFLNSIFGVSSYDIVPNVEQYIKSGGILALKGRMDFRLGKTIIEFKINLSKELKVGLEEITRYTTILRKKGEKIGHCIITDGKTFKVFSMKEDPREIREIDFTTVHYDKAIGFLDTYLFSEKKIPTAIDLNMKFGPGSIVFEKVTEGLYKLFKGLKEPLKLKLWSRNMQLVYGAAPAETAFVSQTYLMMLVRLLLAKYLVKGNPPVLESLNGKLFESQGIKIIEEDFFSWILTPLFWAQFRPYIEILTDALDSYDLQEIDEDIFKEIYQDIVKEADRHRIGEYYTPEWLARLTLDEALAIIDPPSKKTCLSILDPACGSGTFITNAISILKERKCNLDEILDNVFGVDLNPIAVVIARANYLLALGKLVEKRKGPISIPIYMADSVKLPRVRKELVSGISILAIDVDEKTQINLPLDIALDDNKLGKLLVIVGNLLSEYRGKKISKLQAKKIFAKKRLVKNFAPILTQTLDTLIDLIDTNRDSIWIFMMRNIYAPLRLKKMQFDLVVGNPPWVSLRYIENPIYKHYIKTISFKYQLLNSKQTDLFTQLDTSTVFYVKSADMYLKENGVLAFVMPRSVLTGAKQHQGFKKQIKPQMKIMKILDFGKGNIRVEPLFGVDSCTIIAKKGEKTKYPVNALLLSGSLPEKNLRFLPAKSFLTFKKDSYNPPEILQKTSSYHSNILEGACIVPRTLWFIDFVEGRFGPNPENPLAKSLVLPLAKEPWKNVLIKGPIESEFVFATMTGRTILPFKPNFLPVVLPLTRKGFSWQIMNEVDLRDDGKFNMAKWLDAAQNAWKENATGTSLKNFPNALDYVNYHGKLILQKSHNPYYVIYTGSGSHIAAAVVDISKKLKFKVGKNKIKANGFIADYTTFWYATNDLDEANYLVTILNSNVMNKLIKDHQPKGKFGPRHICRLPFEFNIPKFNDQNDLHLKIAKLGQKAAIEADKLPIMSRTKIKKAIPIMSEIDDAVSKLML